MPNYDYRCQDCREIFTIVKSMTEEVEPVCGFCGSPNASRIWNLVIRAGGITQDVGQGSKSSGATKRSGCGSCSSHQCGSCH